MSSGAEEEEKTQVEALATRIDSPEKAKHVVNKKETLAHRISCCKSKTPFQLRVNLTRRDTVTVLDIGTNPIVKLESRGRELLLPHGFTVVSVSNCISWIAQIKVEDGTVHYGFTVAANIDGKWVSKPGADTYWGNTPHNAYRKAFQATQNRDPPAGVNARLTLGVFYPPLQELIHEVFEIEMSESNKLLAEASDWPQKASNKRPLPSSTNSKSYDSTLKPKLKQPILPEQPMLMHPTSHFVGNMNPVTLGYNGYGFPSGYSHVLGTPSVMNASNSLPYMGVQPIFVYPSPPVVTVMNPSHVRYGPVLSQNGLPPTMFRHQQ